jgi:nucleoside-diphosphate-sugar epimerase
MIVVLGARGFVGAAVLAELQQADTCLGVDVDNYAACTGQACDVLVNVNGNSKKFLADEDPAREFELSVASVVRSLQDFPAKKYVYISTVDVYTNFTSPDDTAETAVIDPARQSRYGFHKWLAEQYVRKACGDWLITRLGGMVGPGMKKSPVYDLLHDAPLRVHLDSAFQYIHTREVGRVIRELLQRGITREIVNVCGCGVLSLRALRDLLGKTGQENAGLPRQVYEINNAKLCGLTHVPATRDAVLRFLREEGVRA